MLLCEKLANIDQQTMSVINEDALPHANISGGLTTTRAINPNLDASHDTAVRSMRLEGAPRGREALRET